jgi:hypothetical protein
VVLQIGRVDKVNAYAKSSSDRFARWIDEAGLRSINNRLFALLAGTGVESIPLDIGLAEPISFDDVYFDSTCLKAPIHFPVDWILLRDATRTQNASKHRNAVLREMKKLTRRIASHAQNHLEIPTTRSHETDLSPGQIQQISQRIQGILDQLPAAILQAHERIIGGRKLPNKNKILSPY